jgi:hypothetical protein
MATRRVWLSVLVLAALGAVVALVVARPWEAGGSEDALRPEVRDALGLRVLDVVENTPEGRAIVTTGSDPVGCAVRALGTAPEAVNDAAQAQTVYAWSICWTVVDGKPTTGVSTPVAVHFGSPVRVEKPADGGDYTRSLKAMFPPRLHDVAFDNNRWAGELAGKADARARSVATR